MMQTFRLYLISPMRLGSSAFFARPIETSAFFIVHQPPLFGQPLDSSWRWLAERLKLHEHLLVNLRRFALKQYLACFAVVTDNTWSNHSRGWFVLASASHSPQFGAREFQYFGVCVCVCTVRIIDMFVVG